MNLDINRRADRNAAAIMEHHGRAIARALASGDLERLEMAARAAGTYQAMVAAAVAAGVDRDDLEEALASI